MEIVEFACKRYGLTASRADSLSNARSILADIREEIQKSEIIIADLTGCNANVLYEVGLAHAETDSVILVCEHGQSLPFDLSSLRCIFFDLKSASTQQRFFNDLLNALETLRPIAVPTTVLNGKLERTRSIVTDLEMLARYPDAALAQEDVWFSGFLSTLAISRNESFEPGQELYREALLQEKSLLLELARRGCTLRCIITPPHKDDTVVETVDTTLDRARTLRSLLLDSAEAALRSIEIVVSRFRQKNLYIIGHLCVSEGFKTSLERGYGLTLRQGSSEAVNAGIAAQSALFQELRSFTLAKYGAGQSRGDARSLLRACVIRSLDESLEEFDGAANA